MIYIFIDKGGGGIHDPKRLNTSTVPYNSIHIYKDSAVILLHKNIYTNCIIGKEKFNGDI